MVVLCDIDFDNNPHGTYFAGQVLTGRVTLKSDKPKDVKGIVLNINGFAATRWSESSNAAGKKRQSTTYYGHEDYIASVTYLLGSKADNAQSQRIEPGIHCYNFACQLPLHCPSSFEGLYGHVRYMVKVVLERPWKFDQSYKRCFTVLKMMDLNYDSPLLRMPVHTEVQKTFCCWPCVSEPIQLKLSLPQTGFVPGQEIPVCVLVTNDSHIPVDELKIVFSMLVCYYTQHPSAHTRNERIVVSKMKGDSVMRQCTKSFVYPIRVPATPPTCFNLCRIIQIAYQIEIEAKVKGWHQNEFVRIPVTIGSVPLMSVVQQQPLSVGAVANRNEMLITPQGLTSSVQQTTISDELVPGQANEEQQTLEAGWRNAPNSSPPTPWPNNSNIPPPNYEQAIHMPNISPKNEDDNDGPNSSHTQGLGYDVTDYKPLYPVFNIPSASAPDPSLSTSSGYDNKSTWL